MTGSGKDSAAGGPDRQIARTVTPLNEHVRDEMRKMPSRNTKPELSLRKELYRRGMRYRVNYRDLPGRPDIALTRAKIAVFVDGCFWHACPVHGSLPKNNRGWWKAKLDRNVERDREKDAALIDLGWIPLHYWEHDDIEEVADEIQWVRDSVLGSDSSA
ncbi:very short patch repair endonuclease [Corynebacterium nuruki]|jgi:DNA mismatch endonuclease (patch repair protein)|nr:very short patch repair endonuclease [Corynebacterium nuruki]